MTTKLPQSDLNQFTGGENWYQHTRTLVCEDGNDNIVYTQRVEYMDFPLVEVILYFANGVIHLPSEY